MVWSSIIGAGIGAGLGALDKSKPASSSSWSGPFKPIQGHITNMADRSQAASMTPGVAGPNANITGGQQMMTGVAQRQAPNLGQPGIDLGQQMLQGHFLKPESNPYLKSNLDVASRQITDNFNNQIRPGITFSAIQNGAYGGAAHGLALAQGAKDTQQAVGDTTSRMLMDNYQTERGLQMQAPGLQQASFQTGLLPGSTLYNVGEQQRQLQNEQLNDERNRLAWLKNQLSGFNEATSQSTGAQPSMLNRIMQGAVSGATIGSGF